MPSSIFSDEWRDCLRAHYTHVVRVDDKGTEKTLRHVMIEAGFTESELKEMYVLATAHVDQVGADFVPDREFLEAETAVIVASVDLQNGIDAETPLADELALIDEDSSLTEESDVIDEDASLSDDSALIDGETESEAENDPDDQTPPPAAPDVTQLSLF